MKIAVLGCGPAGLMVAHAVSQAGYDPFIISKREQSQMYGAMYLHQRLPGMNKEPDFNLHIVKQGSAEGYAKKVYKNPEHPVSFTQFEEGKVPAWDLSKAYDWLWSLYNWYIDNRTLDRERVVRLATQYDLVFSTIPATLLCENGHEFKAQPIWVIHGANPSILYGEHLMIYNGDPNTHWYRYSQFGNYQSWEYADEVINAQEHPYRITEGLKPISTNCDCLPDNVIRLGRFGAWKKGCLTHHAYEEAKEVLGALF